MFALPDQTIEDLQDTLKSAVSLKPDHLSLYNLTIKPGTEYYEKYKKGKLKLSTEDEEFDMYNWAINFLKENNFEHYEIANFARPYKRSMHNLIYWQNKPYLGIGAGAYSFLNGYRYMNFNDPARYIKEIMSGKLPVDNGEKLFKTRFGVNLNDIFSKQVDKLVNLVLLEKDDCKIKLTKKGVFLANTVFREFVD
jgi:oxygen-independent coproporphyrinogen-3 oxidase